MAEANGFIRFQIRSKNNKNIEYATFCIPRWIDNKKSNIETWLGRVIDKEKGVFYTREKGYYIFTKENKYSSLSDDEINNYYKTDKIPNTKKRKNRIIAEKPSIITFGDSFVLNNFYNSINLDSIIPFRSMQERDSILSLIFFKIIAKKPYSYAHNWWLSNYTRYLFPYAKLQSQMISELLVKTGEDRYLKLFFNKYLEYLQNNYTKSSILIDSTGLLNNIKFPLTAINNHNSVICKEVRLITVLDKQTKLPIYYHYVPDNIIDISILKTIITELSDYGVKIDRLVLDAGYYSERNITELYNLNIDFMIRMIPRKELYELLIKKFVPNINKSTNIVHYGDRTLFIQKEKINIFHGKIPVNTYICFDPINKSQDLSNYMINLDDVTDDEKLNFDLLKQGIFVLITNLDIDKKNILQDYYYRETIEQFFDYIKNDIKILPLHAHTIDIFSGHLLLSFISTIIYILLDNLLKTKNLSMIKSINYLQHFHCHIIKKQLIPDIPTKNINDVFKVLKLDLPSKIAVDD
ncbi:MAG: transposase [Clostridiales Family XIII bacterium]|jgi:hypothetical protein|nr:transposase [Clostridiales Family XIII bacterium]